MQPAITWTTDAGPWEAWTPRIVYGAKFGDRIGDRAGNPVGGGSQWRGERQCHLAERRFEWRWESDRCRHFGDDDGAYGFELLSKQSRHSHGRCVAIADVDGDGTINNLDLQALISAVAIAQVGRGSGSAAVAVVPTDLAGVGDFGGPTVTQAAVDLPAGSNVAVSLSMTHLTMESGFLSRQVIAQQFVLTDDMIEVSPVTVVKPISRLREPALRHHGMHQTLPANSIDDLFSSAAELFWK